MKSRRDLLSEAKGEQSRDDVLGWIARQGGVQGIQLVDFNYPPHFEGVQVEQVRWGKSGGT